MQLNLRTVCQSDRVIKGAVAIGNRYNITLKKTLT